MDRILLMNGRISTCERQRDDDIVASDMFSSQHSRTREPTNRILQATLWRAKPFHEIRDDRTGDSYVLHLHRKFSAGDYKLHTQRSVRATATYGVF